MLRRGSVTRPYDRIYQRFTHVTARTSAKINRQLGQVPVPQFQLALRGKYCAGNISRVPVRKINTTINEKKKKISLFSFSTWRGWRIDRNEDFLKTTVLRQTTFGSCSLLLWEYHLTSVLNMAVKSERDTRHFSFRPRVPTSNWTPDGRKNKHMYSLYWFSNKKVFFRRSKRTPNLHLWHCNRHSNGWAKLSTYPK